MFKYKYYNEDIANRFVKDCNLPISLTYEKDFEFFLNLYNIHPFYAMDKYMNLVETIETKFNGNPGLFLDEYYSVRDKAIKFIEESDKYKEFLEADLSEFQVGQLEMDGKPIKAEGGDIYSENNINKHFISIDLKKANFQALKRAGLISDDTYRDYMLRFTDIDYILNSKYMRQVIFGKLNTKRQMTIIKWLTYIVHKNISKKIHDLYDAKLLKFNVDELVYELDIKNIGDDDLNFYSAANYISEYLKKTLSDIDVEVSIFQLEAYKLRSLRTKNLKPTFYSKSGLSSDGYSTKSFFRCYKLPNVYSAIVYSLIHGEERAPEEAYKFKYEDNVAIIDDEFELIDYYGH